MNTTHPGPNDDPYLHPNLQDLILERKGDRSYEDISRDSGGYPLKARIQQLGGNRAPRTFPEADTLIGLARGLSVPVSEIVMAAARSLGMPIPPGDPNTLMIAGAGALSDGAKNILFGLARELMRTEDLAQRGTHREDVDDPPFSPAALS